MLGISYEVCLVSKLGFVCLENTSSAIDTACVQQPLGYGILVTQHAWRCSLEIHRLYTALSTVYV